MNKKWYRDSVWVLMIWLFVSILACGGSSPTVVPSQTPQPDRGGSSSDSEEVATMAPRSDGSPQAGLTVINKTDLEMCYVFISLSTNATWGMDWLGDDETILVGRSRTFPLDPGTWDVLIEDCDENVILEKEAIVISGSHTLTVTGSSGSSGDVSGSRCGNGVCEVDEDVYTCDMDCGVCGDGLCTTFENPQNCPQDCGGGSSTCGNGICENGEDVYNCDMDCGVCGDGLCTVFENGGNCPQDCGE